jgi:phosphatidylserine/phosphatidylglycerophosphate/cardiolipin synthase-like enzyme
MTHPAPITACRPLSTALLACLLVACTPDPGGSGTDDTAGPGEACTGPSGLDDPSTGLPDLRCTQAANDGDYFWFARESIEAAQTRVHVIEYLLYDSGLAEQLLLELVDAAERGVEVKVLADEEVDDTAGVLSWLESASGGAIDAKLDSSSTTTHNKLMIIDDLTLVGSHNMSSSALAANHEGSMYLVEPEVTEFYERYFQAMWADSSAAPSLDKPAGDRVVPIVNQEIGGYLIDCIDGAQDELRLVMYALAYRPGEGGDVTTLINHLVQAHDRGVDVAVVLDQSDWIAGNDINDEAIDLLEEHGVSLRLADRDTTTHAKVLRCDRTVIVGDANWSYSSMELYNGSSVRITDDQVAEQYRAWFEEIWDEGEEP